MDGACWKASFSCDVLCKYSTVLLHITPCCLGKKGPDLTLHGAGVHRPTLGWISKASLVPLSPGPGSLR